MNQETPTMICLDLLYVLLRNGYIPTTQMLIGLAMPDTIETTLAPISPLWAVGPRMDGTLMALDSARMGAVTFAP